MISKVIKNKEETKRKVKKYNYNINQEDSRSKKYTKLLKKICEEYRRVIST